MNASISNYKNTRTDIDQENKSVNTLFENVDFKSLTNIIKDHKSNMITFDNVIYTISTNSDKVAEYPELLEAKDKLICCINELNDLYNLSKKHYTNCVLKIGKALNNYGVMTENTEIISSSTVKESQLNILGDLELLEKGHNIFNYAKTYQQSLYAFDNLKSVIDECAQYDSDNTTKDLNKDDITSLYINTYNQTKNFLTNKIDLIFNDVKKKHPAFYLEYRKSRLVTELQKDDDSQNFIFNF